MGGVPYLGFKGGAITEKLKDGYRLPRPENSSLEL